MNKRLTVVVVSIMLLAQTAWAAPSLSVVFVNPDSYTDASYSSAFSNAQDRADVQHDIEQHLRQLAQRILPAGDSLKIEVLDIDLAGRVEPFQHRVGADVRVVRDISWPRMTVRYTLTQGETASPSQEERLSDLSYLTSLNRYSSGDRLRYEKPMLDRWFAERFGKQ